MGKYYHHLMLIAFLVVLTAPDIWARCDRSPEGTTSSKSPADGRFSIVISGEPNTYVPGEQYTVLLRSTSSQRVQHKFKDFMLLVEQESSDPMQERSQIPSVGALQILGDTLTKFSSRCPNAVSQTNSLPKTEIQVLWIAPKSGSGCVVFKATVVEQKDLWYSDDGPLTKVLCEEVQESDDTQPTILKHCCACDEAKYEVTFEGLWSRNTHPKDFPSNGWLTRFSDVIGASHTVDYTFWNYGEIASEGLRQVAENGNTRSLESELKAKSAHIRTIIKARGISYPNVTGKTFAVFRVDSSHHLMSLVSMIDPSPDWIVGVSSLELCLRNCSWAETKVLNLYPWDAGTDDGPTYISPDQPSTPRHPIRRIKINSPNDPRSPFYDSTGQLEMKPFARLYLSRQRLYEKSCTPTVHESGEDDYSPNHEDCEVTQWSEWSPCSATCGKGIMYRQRTYIADEAASSKCNLHLTSRKNCWAPQRYCPNSEGRSHTDSTCPLSTWSEWSSCSATVPCHRGTKTRSRRYRNRSDAKRCAAGVENPPILEHNMNCTALSDEDCEEIIEAEVHPNCNLGHWSSWSPCSASCGMGIKTRHRLTFSPDDEPQAEMVRGGYKSTYRRYYDDKDEEEDETEDDDTNDPCANQNMEEKVDCVADIPDCYEQTTGDDATDGHKIGGFESASQFNYPRYTSEGNVIQSPTGYVVDCDVTQWTQFTKCNVTGSCGRGYKQKSRVINVHPENGGKPCPKRLFKIKKCKIRCDKSGANENNGDDVNPTWGDAKLPKGVHIDCIMGKWSPWSPCSQTCGPTSVQQRTRTIVRHAKGTGQPCLHRLESRSCALLSCPYD